MLSSRTQGGFRGLSVPLWGFSIIHMPGQGAEVRENCEEGLYRLRRRLVSISSTGYLCGRALGKTAEATERHQICQVASWRTVCVWAQKDAPPSRIFYLM